MTVIKLRVYKSPGIQWDQHFHSSPHLNLGPRGLGRIQCAIKFWQHLVLLQPWSCCHLSKTWLLSDPISQLTVSPVTHTELHMNILLGRITENQTTRDEEMPLCCLRTWGQFVTPTWGGSWLPITQVSGDVISSSGSTGQVPINATSSLLHTHKHKFKKKKTYTTK